MAMRGIWMIAGLLGLALARPALAQVPEPLPPEAVEALPVATAPAQVPPPAEIDGVPALTRADARSEEHTSELQSLMRIAYAVFCLKQKQPTQQPHVMTHQHISPTYSNCQYQRRN